MWTPTGTQPFQLWGFGLWPGLLAFGEPGNYFKETEPVAHVSGHSYLCEGDPSSPDGGSLGPQL